jgi:hypothetical protein
LEARRKIIALSFISALLLLVAPTLAQQGAIRETGLRPDSKGGILTAPTIIGEILEVNEHSLLLDTVVGKTYVVLVPQSDLDVPIEKGARVAIDFHRTAHGVAIAAQVREPTSNDMGQMAMMEEDLELAMREDYEFTSFSDGSHKAKAKGGKLLGHTMTGTVVSTADDAIVISTSTGTETIVVTPRTKWSVEPTGPTGRPSPSRPQPPSLASRT